MAERNSSASICPHPRIVWASMPQLQGHSAGNFGKISTDSTVWSENPCQAAHLEDSN
jgi:hypothetical protein